METFEEVYQKYVEQVFRFVYQRVGRRDAAEDITSETFLKLHQNWERIDVSQLPGWLFTVARNAASGYWRRQAVEQRYLEEHAAPAPAPAADLGWLFEHAALKPSHRVCLVLRYVHGMDRAEIAKQTGLTENQVKSCLQYARELLRKELAGGSND
jgi:RNA polymerase sigma-70 factor (ECF subfamily)